jgi:hypothetical protein
VRHEGTVKVKGRIRQEAGDIADCLPSVALAKGGGFPPPLKLRRTGRLADLTAKNTKNAKREFFFVLFVLFVVKEHFMRRRTSDFFTCDNGGSGVAFGLFPLFAPVKSLPNQCAFRLVAPGHWEGGCPRKAVFLSLLSLLSLFAANQLKSLSMNNLQENSSISN